VPYAILLGLVTGIFSAVPYLGGVGLPIAIILLWVEQLTLPPGVRMSTLWIIGGPTLVYAIMQILETYVITPTIAGKATNLDPVTILVAVLAGGSVGGVYGMLLSIPVAACLKILLTDVVMPGVREWVKGQSEDPLPL
jgi:predicted PurR-regulated permease PerM